jgi:hypothetical protein
LMHLLLRKMILKKSACTRIGADVKAFLSASKASSTFSFYIRFVLFREASQWSSNFGIVFDEDPIKVFKFQEILHILN